MQNKKNKNQCVETRGIFRCEGQHGHISERHHASIGDGRTVMWFKCRECGRNHLSSDHFAIEARVAQQFARKNLANQR